MSFPWPTSPPPGMDVPRRTTTHGGLDILAQSLWWVLGLPRPRLIGLGLRAWTRGPWIADLPHRCQHSTELLRIVGQRGPTESGLCPTCHGMIPFALVVFGNARHLSGGPGTARCMDCGHFGRPLGPQAASAHAQMALHAAWRNVEKRLLSLPCVDT